MTGNYPYCVAAVAHVCQMVHTIPPRSQNAFFPPLYQGLYRGAEEIGVKFQLTGRDSLLHVGI
jgi:hypothetical protein